MELLVLVVKREESDGEMVPSNEILGAGAKLDIVWKVECLAPVDDLLVGLSAVFGAEWWPTDQTLEHDRTHTPPVTAEGVALSTEDLGRNVVWSADRGVCHDTAGLPPLIDLGAIADCEVDLVEGDRHAIFAWFAGGFEELLVVGVFVLSVEARTEAEIGEFDVAAAVKEDVVRFYIAVQKHILAKVAFTFEDRDER